MLRQEKESDIQKGCQIVGVFTHQNTILVKFKMALKYKLLLYSMPFGMFIGKWHLNNLLVYFVFIWNIFPVLVPMLCQEKSGNPDIQMSSSVTSAKWP
jgi:hypothetical protein